MREPARAENMPSSTGKSQMTVAEPLRLSGADTILEGRQPPTPLDNPSASSMIVAA